jgi:hypothetical protein
VTTYDEARALALERIADIPSTHEIILLDNRIVETPDTWYFPYNGRAYVEHGTFSAALAGNHPVRVCRTTGAVSLTSPPQWT